MKAQHGRMAAFRSGMRTLREEIGKGSAKTAAEHVSLLLRAMDGYENDVPHKNASRIGEYRRLYAELGRSARKLELVLQANDLKRANAAYGKVLQICAACHRKFRD